MKRSNTILFLLLAFALGMAACFDDDTRLGTDFIPDIELGEMRDTAMVSYAGNILSLAPEIDAPYAESELSYAWYIYDASNATTTDGSELDGFRTEKIGDQRTLDYEVNLPSGTYGIVFEVTASQYNYSRRTSMTLTTSTAFSRGFYILKETADGRSDLDLAVDGKLSEDVLANMLGAPLEGAPVNLSVAYGHGYIDEETQEMAYTKTLNVFTEEDFRAFRTEDLVQVHDRSTIFYEEPADDEVLYSIQQGTMAMYLFTNKGYYGGTACGDMMGMFEHVSSGKYGFPINAGASKFAQQLGGGFSGVAFWNEADRALNWADYNASSCMPIEYELPSGMDASTAECLASGLNYVGSAETVWFLIEASGRRCLITFNGTSDVSEVRAIDPSSRFASAGIVAGNARSASIIYFVSDNALWGYNLSGGSEFSIPLPGVEGTISYVSNPFLNVGFFGTMTENFDALAVATTTASGYNLYIFDDMVGGAPQSAVEPYRGTGAVHSVRYVPGVQVNLDDMQMAVNFGPVAPWTD